MVCVLSWQAEGLAAEANEYPVGTMESDVAPVWWTPQYYRRRWPQCRERVEPMRQNSNGKWSSWSEPDERLESWLGSLSRPPSRYATGLPRRTVMKAAVGTA